uniref:Cytochrome c oxidase subunit 8 n=1 Tax=Monodelphis domestica TaxID=13616 RepID=A0A5F8GD58_MONDO
RPRLPPPPFLLPAEAPAGQTGALTLPRAHISARPARDPTSSGEQAAALLVTFVTFLGPPGWILAHFDSYKQGSA